MMSYSALCKNELIKTSALKIYPCQFFVFNFANMIYLGIIYTLNYKFSQTTALDFAAKLALSTGNIYKVFFYFVDLGNVDLL